MAFEFKIQIKGISKPPVWRKLKVPANFSFHNFHLAIQNAFGWYNCHLYEFSYTGYDNGFSIQFPHPDNEGYEIDSSKKKLNSIFKYPGDQFLYIYDFGDGWTHKIVLEKVSREKVAQPGCAGVKGKCPPENIGGVEGYQNFSQLGNDPDNPEYIEMLEWMLLGSDEKWDPAEFDLEEAKDRVTGGDYSK